MSGCRSMFLPGGLCRAGLCCTIRGDFCRRFPFAWFRRARKERSRRSSGSGRSTTFAFPFNRPTEQQWVRLPDRRLRRVTIAPVRREFFRGWLIFRFFRRGGSVGRSGVAVSSSAGDIAKAALGWRRAFRLRFSLRRGTCRCRREVLVYPRIEPTRGSLRNPAAGAGRVGELYARARVGSATAFANTAGRFGAACGLEGDGEVGLAEGARIRAARMSAGCASSFDNPEPGVISERAYERAVDLTASLAWHFSAQEAEVSFVVPGRPRTRDLHEFLAWLAVIQPGVMQAAEEKPEATRAAVGESTAGATASPQGWRAQGFARDPLLEISRNNGESTTLSSRRGRGRACRRPCGTLPIFPR